MNDIYYLNIQKFTSAAHTVDIAKINIGQVSWDLHSMDKQINPANIVSYRYGYDHYTSYFKTETYLLLGHYAISYKQNCCRQHKSLFYGTINCKDAGCINYLVTFTAEIYLIKHHNGISMKYLTFTFDAAMSNLWTHMHILTNSLIYVDNDTHIIDMETLDFIHQNYQYCSHGDNVLLLRNPTDNLIYVWYDPMKKMVGTLSVANDRNRFSMRVTDDILYIDTFHNDWSHCEKYYANLKLKSVCSTNSRIEINRENETITLSLVKNLFDKYICIIAEPLPSKIIDSMSVLYDVLSDVSQWKNTDNMTVEFCEEKSVLILTIDYKYVKETHRFQFAPLLSDRLDVLETKVNYLLQHKN